MIFPRFAYWSSFHFLTFYWPETEICSLQRIGLRKIANDWYYFWPILVFTVHYHFCKPMYNCASVVWATSYPIQSVTLYYIMNILYILLCTFCTYSIRLHIASFYSSLQHCLHYITFCYILFHIYYILSYSVTFITFFYIFR
jgi:hypothetical protein